MIIHIFCFSPTGTTLKIAERIASGIKTEYETHNLTYSRNVEAIISADDFAIVAVPVYGGRMAPVAKERMAAVKGSGTPCAVVAVYGNRSFENALADMSDFVRAAGFRPIAAGAFIGEHSYSTPNTPIAAGRPDMEDLTDAHSFGALIAAKISNNDFSEPDIMALKPQSDPHPALNNFRTFVAGYQMEQKNNPTKLLPTTDTERCSQCGICMDVCPTHAIADDFVTIDPGKCIKCCACVKSCPDGAKTLDSPFAPVLSANFSTRKSPQWIL